MLSYSKRIIVIVLLYTLVNSVSMYSQESNIEKFNEKINELANQLSNCVKEMPELSLAIAPPPDSLHHDPVANAIYDAFVLALNKRDSQFKLVTREKQTISKVLSEYHFEMSDLFDDENIKSLPKFKTVDGLLIWKYNKNIDNDQVPLIASIVKLQSAISICTERIYLPTGMIQTIIDNWERYPGGDGPINPKQHSEKDQIKFIFVSGGQYTMGDFAGEGSRDEKPTHPVKLSNFYISETEVTFGQFKTFVKKKKYITDAENQGWAYIYSDNGWEKKNEASWKKPGFPPNDALPVVCVSWNDAKNFCNWKHGRLPTEAEWEYVARDQGKNILYPTGKNRISGLANIAGRNGKDIWRDVSPVKSFPPNQLGLYDLAGNVWEWCNDWFDKYYYGKSPIYNPSGPKYGRRRILRGGSWGSTSIFCRTSNRYSADPEERYSTVGFRVVIPESTYDFYYGHN